MSYMTTERPVAGEPLLAPTTQRARSRAEAFLAATEAMLDMRAPRDNGLLSECYAAPFAEFVLAATCCARPLLFPEGELIGDATGHDVILLRFDADRGTSFDVLRYGSGRWLCHYLAWRRRDGDLWLIPTAGDGAYVRATGWGLHCQTTPPYQSDVERTLGIILALESPSFEGSN